MKNIDTKKLTVIIKPLNRFPHEINERLNETLPLEDCINAVKTLIYLEKCGLGNYKISEVCNIFQATIENSRKVHSFMEDLFK